MAPGQRIVVKEYGKGREAVWVDGREQAGAGGGMAHAADWFRYVFLPNGYPDTVTDDYASYQAWDTLQALFSGVTGTLATKAVFVGVGVGEATASSTAATVTWLAKDGLGMVGRIAFASQQSSALDSDAKRWRLAADVANDVAIFLRIASGFCDRSLFLPLLCAASLATSICGVCAGATRAALTQHFSIRHNMADVSAKDGNQETAVSLLGILLGTAVAVLPDSGVLTAVLFVLFTGLHLYCNYRGVRSVVLPDVNRQRLEMCLRRAEADGGRFPDPRWVNANEGILFYATARVKLGASVADVAPTPAAFAAFFGGAGGGGGGGRPWATGVAGGAASVVLFPRATVEDQVNAYCEAYFLLRGLDRREAEARVAALRPVERLAEKGWNLSRVLLNAEECRVEVVTEHLKPE
ncbi:RUS1 family protein-like protein [Diplonema papillatum]|nr:RUS1 family protein-like protein [Diplonema papillatum]